MLRVATFAICRLYQHVLYCVWTVCLSCCGDCAASAGRQWYPAEFRHTILQNNRNLLGWLGNVLCAFFFRFSFYVFMYYAWERRIYIDMLLERKALISCMLREGTDGDSCFDEHLRWLGFPALIIHCQLELGVVLYCQE